MSNTQLLIAMEVDSGVANHLTRDVMTAVTLQGSVMKPDALPTLRQVKARLATALAAATELVNRAEGNEPPAQRRD